MRTTPSDYRRTATGFDAKPWWYKPKPAIVGAGAFLTAGEVARQVNPLANRARANRFATPRWCSDGSRRTE